MNVARNFAFEHLPPKLQQASRPFCNLALAVDQTWPDSMEEKQACLRRLLEAKDCAVRCALEVLQNPASYAEAADDGTAPVTQPSGA